VFVAIADSARIVIFEIVHQLDKSSNPRQRKPCRTARIDAVPEQLEPESVGSQVDRFAMSLTKIDVWRNRVEFFGAEGITQGR
jgi:hypothetical protein